MKLRVMLVVLAVVALQATAEGFAVTRTGSPQADTLRGTSTPDVLLGRGGNDRLNGRGGNDLLSGGRGRDTIVCGPGLDAVIADRADRIHPTCELVASRSGLSTRQPDRTPAPEVPEGEGGEPTDEKGAEDEILLAWLFPAGGDPDWTEGVVLFLLGVTGALVTAYLFLGEFLPSMGGKAEYESDTWDLKSKKEARDKLHVERAQLARAEPVNERQVRALESMSDDLSAEIDQIQERRASERWRLIGVGIPVYVLLGGAFATVFATSLPQALLIGFGWVAVADRLGLKRETKVRDDIREKEIEKLENEADNRTEEAVKLKDERKSLQKTLAATQEQADRSQGELTESRKRAAEAEAELVRYREASEIMSRQVQDMRTPPTSETQP